MVAVIVWAQHTRSVVVGLCLLFQHHLAVISFSYLSARIAKMPWSFFSREVSLLFNSSCYFMTLYLRLLDFFHMETLLLACWQTLPTTSRQLKAQLLRGWYILQPGQLPVYMPPSLTDYELHWGRDRICYWLHSQTLDRSKHKAGASHMFVEWNERVFDIWTRDVST